MMNEELKREAREMCSCGGKGYELDTQHDSDCDGSCVLGKCPIQVQVQCPQCEREIILIDKAGAEAINKCEEVVKEYLKLKNQGYPDMFKELVEKIRILTK